MEKKELIGLSKSEIEEEILKLGEKKFRSKQLWQWLYFRGETDFAKMTNFSKELREKLAENFTITRPKIVAEQLSKDKTRKWLLEFKDGERVEMVYIPEEDRGAVCISTQVGCAVGCKFCHTGSQKLTRNLTAGEIVSQFMVARDTYGEWPSPTNEVRYLSNIVVMGMGEPLHNQDNVIKALNILTDGDGIAISRRRVTMSTSGIAPKIVETLKATGVRLAVSLHAPNNEIRSQIMPINKTWFFSHSTHLNYLVMGASDYYYFRSGEIPKPITGEERRDYDLGTGFNFKTSLNFLKPNWGNFGLSSVLYGMTTISSSVPEKGSGGFTLININSVDFDYKLTEKISTGVSWIIYNKWGFYDTAEDVGQYSSYLTLFLKYRLI